MPPMASRSGTTPVTASATARAPVVDTESPMPIPRARSRHGRSPARIASIQAFAFAVLLGVLASGPVAAADLTPAPAPAHPAGAGGAQVVNTATADIAVSLTQTALSYDASTNRAQVR